MKFINKKSGFFCFPFNRNGLYVKNIIIVFSPLCAEIHLTRPSLRKTIQNNQYRCNKPEQRDAFMIRCVLHNMIYERAKNDNICMCNNIFLKHVYTIRMDVSCR